MLKPPSKSHWQKERAILLHRACLAVQTAIQQGQPVCKTLRGTARRYDGRQLKSYPPRTLRLSAVTMRRVWRAWNRGGQVASALHLKFAPAIPQVPAPVLVHFAEFAAARRQPSLKAAWQHYSTQRERQGRAISISYGQMRRLFPVPAYYQMQAALAKIEAEQATLARLRLEAIADLRRRLPDQLPRRRPGRALNFSI